MNKLKRLSEKKIEEVVDSFTKVCKVCGSANLTVKACAIITVIYEYKCHKCKHEWIENAGY